MFFPVEPWGVVALPQSAGYAITCGTGIEPEQCNSGLPKAVHQNCTKGIGDNRPGAVPRKPDVWQSMVVLASTKGELLWQRVDSHRPPHQRVRAAERRQGQRIWEGTAEASPRCTTQRKCRTPS